MRPKLKEDPKEWRKFTIVLGVMALVIDFVLFQRDHIGKWSALAVFAIAAVMIGFSAIKPQWFRWLYRSGMTASFHIGHIMGGIILTIIFVIILTPLGWALKLMGKDVLETKKPPHHTRSYWHDSKHRNPNHFEKQF
ncbi:MAG: hypothetical protein K9N48_04755 [Verrucomicrobia bacterium]|nr:hypothetical protein [Verrucomicrobiota bacterium]MCF7707429.1 hypothetical protein [Verrucomicrobiota bacterium]